MMHVRLQPTSQKKRSCTLLVWRIGKNAQSKASSGADWLVFYPNSIDIPGNDQSSGHDQQRWELRDVPGDVVPAATARSQRLGHREAYLVETDRP
jgi:hypothetical protein